VCSMLSGALLGFFRPEAAMQGSQKTLTFAERVAYQRAIEEVYWRHRIWPRNGGENPDPKPSLDAVISQAQLEKKVEDYLRKSQALEDYWQRPITTEQLQAEMDRVAHHTKQPDVLRELFASLGDDPFVIAECLARPVLAERTLATVASVKESGVPKPETQVLIKVAAIDSIAKTVQVNHPYHLPAIASPSSGCIDDTWTATGTTNPPRGRELHTAVWTGSEMIVWGGDNTGGVGYNTGGRYNPSTDSWTATSTTNAPTGRFVHTAVWTGSEMIVWGGLTNCNSCYVATGARYNPGTDSWIATSTTNAPEARYLHTAVWTGSEMIVWGGYGNSGYLSTGARYNPGTNSWTATSTTDAPGTRASHTAAWTESEMIVWGGVGTGGRTNTGGKYNPGTDSWIATSITDAPSARSSHTVVWTGGEMIIWGGSAGSGNYLNTGGRYDPDTDSWTATTIANAPPARYVHTAIWSGSEMIVWGGWAGNPNYFNTGGRYCAQSGPPPSPTPTPTPTPTATPCTGRCSPTPRPRPTPAPRP